jgi:hypothetical protein
MTVDQVCKGTTRVEDADAAQAAAAAAAASLGMAMNGGMAIAEALKKMGGAADKSDDGIDVA